MSQKALEALRSRVAALLQEAEAAYRQEAGGAAVCRLHKDGRVSGGLKYEEGRVIALRALRRTLDRTPAAAQPDDLLAAEQMRWLEELDRHRAQNRSLPWIAYSQGGLDALTALRNGVSAA